MEPCVRSFVSLLSDTNFNGGRSSVCPSKSLATQTDKSSHLSAELRLLLRHLRCRFDCLLAQQSDDDDDQIGAAKLICLHSRRRLDQSDASATGAAAGAFTGKSLFSWSRSQRPHLLASSERGSSGVRCARMDILHPWSSSSSSSRMVRTETSFRLVFLSVCPSVRSLSNGVSIKAQYLCSFLLLPANIRGFCSLQLCKSVCLASDIHFGRFRWATPRTNTATRDSIGLERTNSGQPSERRPTN